MQRCSRLAVHDDAHGEITGVEIGIRFLFFVTNLLISFRKMPRTFAISCGSESVCVLRPTAACRGEVFIPTNVVRAVVSAVTSAAATSKSASAKFSAQRAFVAAHGATISTPLELIA